VRMCVLQDTLLWAWGSRRLLVYEPEVE